MGTPLSQFLRVEQEVISSVIVYLRIQAIGGIIAFSFWPINEIIRNLGKMDHAMILMVAVLFLQGLFDYLLILGNLGFFQIGVAGDSLNRAFSGAIGAGAGFWWLRKGKTIIKLNLKNWQDFKINPKILKEIIRIAGFNTIQSFCRQMTQVIMLAIIVPFGTLVIGAYEIGQRFFRCCTMFGMDIGKTAAIGCVPAQKLIKIETEEEKKGGGDLIPSSFREKQDMHKFRYTLDSEGLI